jgi:hypothetical protein
MCGRCDAEVIRIRTQGFYIKRSRRISIKGGEVEPKDEDLDRLETVLAATVEYVWKEPLVLAQLEQYFSPKPASLGSWKELRRRVGYLVERLGGPPMLIIQGNDEPKPRYDLYPAAALHEVTTMFHRTRRSVTRAHMLMIGSHIVHETPEIFPLPTEGGIRGQFLETVESAFWEQAETVYIRLASYWDRVGQSLDFAFFGIRQFERDGFTAVIDRIRANFVVHMDLLSSPAWISVRAFQTSEREDGLKWLLRRRNLLVHSLYLRPIQEPQDRALFESEFNHIEVALREKLAPGNPVQEVERMHLQLQKAAELFPSALELCEHAADVRRHGRAP